ncbi:hypothetical protein HDU76_008711 [Blyttiomyces sp. JEL0837]|nr:hypothetical protein HDU76_008711 [Blyttiomyces sp. JEL0837]
MQATLPPANIASPPLPLSQQSQQQSSPSRTTSTTTLQQQQQQATTILQPDGTLLQIEPVSNTATGSGPAWPSWLPSSSFTTAKVVTQEPEALPPSPSPTAGANKKLVSEEGENVHGHHHHHDIGEVHQPPWRTALESSLKQNEKSDTSHLFASLATIKSFGRPANRVVFFRGFLSDGCERDHEIIKQHSSHRHATPSPLERLANVMVFAIDVRSGSVEDLIHGSRFGEICWFFPHTREQFRISGELHLVVAPDHLLSTQHKIAPPFSSTLHFPQLDWERKRLDVWRRLSNVRRASFTWPKTSHSPTASNSGASPLSATGSVSSISEHDASLRHPADSHAIVGGGLATTVVAGAKHEFITSLEPRVGTPIDPNAIGSDAAKNEADAEAIAAQMAAQAAAHEAHQVALHNFCLLLLDVDGADHLRMGEVPHARTKYRRCMDAWTGSILTDSAMDLSERGIEKDHVHAHHGRHSIAAVTGGVKDVGNTSSSSSSSGSDSDGKGNEHAGGFFHRHHGLHHGAKDAPAGATPSAHHHSKGVTAIEQLVRKVSHWVVKDVDP